MCLLTEHTTYFVIPVFKSLNGFTCTTGECKTSRNPATGKHYYYCWIRGNFPKNWDYCTPKHNSEKYQFKKSGKNNFTIKKTF